MSGSWSGLGFGFWSANPNPDRKPAAGLGAQVLAILVYVAKISVLYCFICVFTDMRIGGAELITHLWPRVPAATGCEPPARSARSALLPTPSPSARLLRARASARARRAKLRAPLPVLQRRFGA